MTKFLPETPSFGENKGEEEVYKYLKENLKENEICYHNYTICGKEFDFCAMIPNIGIVMIEVKSWKTENIININRNEYITYKGKEENIYLRNPYLQASEYGRLLRSEIHSRTRRDIFVLPLVWYTNITEEEYNSTELNILSPRRYTLFKEDLEQNRNFSNKIKSILKDAIKFYNKSPDIFNSFTLEQSRNIFETEEEISKEKIEISKQSNKRNIITKKHYSILNYIPKISNRKGIIEKINFLLEQWIKGVKLYIISNDFQTIELFSKKLEEKMEQENIRGKFEINQENDNMLITYNLNYYYSDSDINEEILIYDGKAEQLGEYKLQLEEFNKLCGFNMGQYKIEHNSSEDNIVVRAGAGTGKTHTMISRIMFLIYDKKMNYKSIVENITMITFTNEAANQMKEKIKNEIMNYYILTGDFNYFQMISEINNMNISTIHSLVLRVLEKYGELMGYGNDLSISSATIERKLELEKSLNKQIKKREKEKNNVLSILREFNFTLYEFQKFLLSLFEKLENKNIDILNIKLDLDDRRDRDFNNLVKTILIETEKNVRSTLKANNTIKLSHLVIELENLYNKLIDNYTGNVNNSYLFIDEFQDTDNIQIDLILRLRDIFKYKLFVVGDVKQSIYRFRGAEENSFKRLLEGGDKWEKFELNKNYRTDKHLLLRYNDIFLRWGKNGVLPYGEGDRLISDKRLNDETDNFYKIIGLNSDKDKNEFEEKLIEEITFQKNEIKEKGTIAILVRENKDAENIINIGKRHGIQIDNRNLGGLYKIEPTLDFYKLVIALKNNKSPKHLINLYDTNYIRDKLNIKGVFQNKDNKDKLYKYIMSNWPIEDWKEYLNSLKEDTVLKVLRDIVKTLRPWEVYGETYMECEDDLEMRKSYYKKNLDMLFEKLSNGKKIEYLTLNKIEQFLKIMISTSQKEETRVELSNESHKRVICVTVHKAKGLEYDTVILPYTSADMKSSKKSGKYDFIIIDEKSDPKTIKVGYKINDFRTGIHRQNSYYFNETTEEMQYRLNEETRILYVAMTRARKELVSFTYKDNRNEESWQNYLKKVTL